MEQQRYIITGKNRLTAEREALTPPITLETARKLMEWEVQRRCRGKYLFAYTYLKIDKVQPNQLRLWN